MATEPPQTTSFAAPSLAPSAIRRCESQVSLSEQGERYRRSWLPPEPTRAMILVHGFAEHSGRYDEMAMHFAARGFAVHAYDQAGHGRTRGARGHVDRFDRLVEELTRFVSLVTSDHPDLPISVVGHSMGGLVVAATAAFERPPVDRFVVSGPALDLGGGGLERSISLWLARILAVVAPRLGMATGLDVEGLSRDPEVIARYRADPYVKDRMSARFAAGMTAMVSATRLAADRIERPILILHGEADPICPVAGSRLLHKGLAPEIASASELLIYPGLRHEIFNEPERERVWQDVLDWVEA